ncbi:MAG TPA: hypothetical protein GX016_09955 [Firmicutes bacterium]|jgi:ABC-2 type transport system permease protein|nr:hypothetical protein [Bacillota bacterium]
MVKLWATFKLLLISNYFTWRTTKRDSKKQVGLILLAGLSLLPFFRLLFELSSGIYQATTILGDPSLALLLAAAAGQFTVLVFGVPYLASAFYYEDDFVRLAPLPLAPWQLAGAKLLLVWLGELLTLLLTVAPILVVYGLRARPSALYWLILPIVYLLLPALPLAVATPVTALVMRFSGRFRDRDKARVLFSLLFLVLVLGLQATLMRSGDDPSLALQEKLLARPDLAAGVKSWLPPAVWFGQALAQAGSARGLMYLFLFALVSGAALAVLALLAPGVVRQALAEREAPVRSNNRHKRRKARLATSAGSSPFIACLEREARLFWRTPIFALNGTINLFLLPLIILFPFLARGELKQVVDFVMVGGDLRWLAGLILAGIGAVTAAMNQVPSTAISREGSLLFWSLVLPLSPRTQLLAKLTFSLSLQCLAAVAWAAVAYFFFHLSGLPLLAGTALGLLAAWPLAEVGLMIDLTWPRTQWTDPQKAMKGNFNGLLAGLAGWLLVALGGFILWLLYRAVGSFTLLYLAAAVYFTALGVVFDRLLLAYGTRRWPRLLS